MMKLMQTVVIAAANTAVAVADSFWQWSRCHGGSGLEVGIDSGIILLDLYSVMSVSYVVVNKSNAG